MNKSTALGAGILATILLALLARLLFAPGAGDASSNVQLRDRAKSQPIASNDAPEIESTASAAHREETPASAQASDPPLADFSKEGRALTVRVVDGGSRKACPNVLVFVVEQREVARGSAQSGADTPRFADFYARSLRTDGAGLAPFRDTKPARYRVSIDDDDLESRPVEFDFGATSDRTLEIVASKVPAIPTWRASLTGSVVDLLGKPIAGATVSVRGLTTRLDVANESDIATDAKGRFRIDRIAVPVDGDQRSCKVSLVTSSSRYIDFDTCDVEIVPGENAPPRALVLRDRGGSISGRLLDSAGNPAIRIVIGFTGVDGSAQQFGRAVSDKAGRFSFPALPAGRYVLECDAICLAATRAIDLSKDQDFDAGDLRGSEREVELRGTAVFEDGSPAARIAVQFKGQRANTDDEGTFALSLCNADPGDLEFTWSDAPAIQGKPRPSPRYVHDERDGQSAWRQTERGVRPGGAPLRVTLVRRGIVVRLFDAGSRAQMTKCKVELTLLDSRGATFSDRFSTANGEARIPTDESAAGKAILRVVVDGYQPTDSTFVIPSAGYTKREVLEVALEPN